MDILSQAAADTTAIHLKGIDGEYLYSDGKPCRIVIYGPGSKQGADVEARQTSRAVKRMQDNDGKVSVPSPEQRDQEQAEDLASITHSFDNFSYSAAPGATGQELFAAVYSNRKLGHITAQVLKAYREWGNFKAASPAS